MKKIICAISTFVISFTAMGQVLGDVRLHEETLSEGLRFCEGTTVYRNSVLVSNFGSTQLDPMNNQGKGYIMSVGTKSSKQKILIPSDGNLSAPKGMIVVGKHLYIADVGRVVVYDLELPMRKPQVVTFPQEDTFVNDLEHIADMVIVSVTNTGRIYAIDATNPSNLAGQTPKLMGRVPGANGMVVSGAKLYIASYNPTGKPDEANVIYSYDIFSDRPSMTKLVPNLKPGQYDGIAVSEDGATIYFTSWGDGTEEGKASIFAYNLDGKSDVRKLDFGIELQGPADISVKDGYIWIPDLPASKLYKIPL